jgi:hypothetical protein
MFSVPILFLIYNRLDETKLVFENIRNIRPKFLYIAADGPKNSNIDKKKCKLTREYVLKNIDWECQVKTLIRSRNLGCRIAVSSAITWFFKNVCEGIILEDDCLPNKSFYSFCQKLLKKYRTDDRIIMISGDNFQNKIQRGEASYYFSKYCHVWGWASWRRAWKDYDVDIKSFPKFKKLNILNDVVTNYFEKIFWMRIFQNIYSNKSDTWDHQLSYLAFSQNKLAIVPNFNLISNIGFGANSSRTRSGGKLFSNLETKEIKKIIHPKFINQNKLADSYTFLHLFFPLVLFQLKEYFNRKKLSNKSE